MMTKFKMKIVKIPKILKTLVRIKTSIRVIKIKKLIYK